MADFVSVESWLASDGQEYRHSSNDGYGRIIILWQLRMYWVLKFTIYLIDSPLNLEIYPSSWTFVLSFLCNLLFFSWLLLFGIVVNQKYESELMPTEYVIRGNSAILKCSVPSFVADFVTVEAWVTSEGQTYTRDSIESK